MHRPDGRFIAATIVLFLIALGCNRAGYEIVAPDSIQLSSADITDGVLSKVVTCYGRGSSPQLSWSTPPSHTRSLALVVTDLDAPFGYRFVHWLIYNIPLGTLGLPGDLTPKRELSNGIAQGLNDKGEPGYTPPCPHSHSTHRYQFILYALDIKMDQPLASKKDLFNAMRPHVLAEGKLTARYAR